MFRKAKTVAGLDIGSSAVKAVELKASGKGFRVAAFGLAPLPPDSIVDGAIIDAVFAQQYAVLPSAQVKFIPNSRHFIMLDQPKAFAEAVETFLK